jgi:phage terminase large subunit-like protein
MQTSPTNCPTPSWISGLTRSEKLELLELLEEKQRRIKGRKLLTYYPDEGPLRRELYPKHLEFFRAGATHRERLMLAANRVGKTEGVGGYETALHLTGQYPSWWEGRTFDRPIQAWCAGDTAKTVRDILQGKLMGPVGEFGTGLVPRETIDRTTAKPGVADAIEAVYVKHVSGGMSVLQFKSYDQGREVFQGTEQDLIWLDEEPDLGIYVECLLRTMTTNGMMLCTFTPLLGLSETVLAFMPNGSLEETDPHKHVTSCTWDDVPHLSADQKEALWNSIPPFQRDARSKGIPQLGAGAIFPVPESEITCDPFEIPEHWPRVYGLDVGWNKTAAIWLAHDRESQTVYAYAEHYRGQAEPSVHASAIKARGDWIPGVIDPAARGRGQVDGTQLLTDYRDLGLSLSEADNAVEAGLFQLWERLSGGRLKIFKTLQNTMAEYRIYRRDEKGRVVKKNDHAMDALRYAVVSGMAVAATKPVRRTEPEFFPSEFA